MKTVILKIDEETGDLEGLEQLTEYEAAMLLATSIKYLNLKGHSVETLRNITTETLNYLPKISHKIKD